MWRRLVVVLAAIVLMASGCFWDQPGFDATGSNNNFTETGIGVNNVASLHTRWSASLANPAIGVTQSDVGLIDISDGTTLTAVDPSTGATVWSRTEPSGVKVSSATGDGNNILVATIESPTDANGDLTGPSTANLEVRDARTGATVSTTPIAPTGEMGPGIPFAIRTVTKSGPWVVTPWFGLGTSSYSAFGQAGFQVTNLDDPSLSWHFDSDASALLDSYTQPVIVGDRLYLEHDRATEIFSTTTDTIAAWNLSGCRNQCAPLFETEVVSGTEPFPLEEVSPIGSQDQRAVYGGTGGGFAAFDPATGATQWRVTIAGSTFSKVFATTDDAEVVGSSLSNGGTQLAVYPRTCAAAPCAPTWSATVPNSTNLDNAVVANGVIYATVEYFPTGGNLTYTLAAYPLDCTDGCQPLWTLPVPDGIAGGTGPIVSNGQVLYETYTGKVVALTP